MYKAYTLSVIFQDEPGALITLKHLIKSLNSVLLGIGSVIDPAVNNTEPN